MRQLGGKSAAEFPVLVDEEGEVTVGSYPIGRMEGFAFEVDPSARHADRKMLLATAERRLGGEYEKRAAALVADSDDHFSLRTDAGAPVAILWRGHEVARLGPGKNLLSPRVNLDRRIERVSDRARAAVVERLKAWVRGEVERWLAPLRRAGAAAQDSGTPAAVRSILALLVDEGGIVAREAVAKPLSLLDREQRRGVTGLRVRIGALDLFMPEVLKPEAMRWRTALRAAAGSEAMPPLPAASSVLLVAPATDEEHAVLARLGFRPLGPQMLRVDMVERLARHAHEARTGAEGTPVDEPLVTSLGLQPAALARLMRELGFRQAQGQTEWTWRGRGRRRPPRAPADVSHAFAALSALRRG
jgi:ATP-dependent RNA helicase SUPV3L1/SUV3